MPNKVRWPNTVVAVTRCMTKLHRYIDLFQENTLTHTHTHTHTHTIRKREADREGTRLNLWGKERRERGVGGEGERGEVENIEAPGELLLSLVASYH